MHENELPHWLDDGAMAKADERSAKLFFQAGREQVAPYKKQTRLFKSGEVFPGVTAVPSCERMRATSAGDSSIVESRCGPRIGGG